MSIGGFLSSLSFVARVSIFVGFNFARILYNSKEFSSHISHFFLRMNFRNVDGKCTMFLALPATRNKISQGANSANPRMQLTSLWLQLVVLLLSIRRYPLRLCPAPGLRKSFLLIHFFQISSQNAPCAPTRGSKTLVRVRVVGRAQCTLQ